MKCEISEGLLEGLCVVSIDMEGMGWYGGRFWILFKGSYDRGGQRVFITLYYFRGGLFKGSGWMSDII